ncbi:MAG: MFS transporter [Candidatus Rhabdochlamydia sp.]
MMFYINKIIRCLEDIFFKIPGFSPSHQNSVQFLNIAQFTGVLNDNIFKLVTAFLLIDMMGEAYASKIMSVAGAVFVIPFLVFSSVAGTLADRLSKQRLLMGMKVVEMGIMLVAMLVFGSKSVLGSYFLLFLLATHSAMFGPSKYAIISELVPPHKVSSANGLITSFTYLGVIVGTFLASFLTEITAHHFVAIAGICLLIALAGFIATFGVKYTPPCQGDHPPKGLFMNDILKTLQFCKTKKHLLIAMYSSAYFLFVGAFIQLNVIPFAMTSLGLSDVAGGYLFLSTALGIAVGSYLSGKISRQRVEIGMSCFAGVLIALSLGLLFLFSTHLIAVICFQVFLGVCGGLFIVPFDTFVQVYSPDAKRGQILAASNFLSFCGVLIASLLLFVFSDILQLSPAAGFGMISLLTFGLSIFLLSKLSSLALPFFSQYLLKPLFRLRVQNLELLEKYPGAILVLTEATWLKAFLFLSLAPYPVHIFFKQEKRQFPWISRICPSIHWVDPKKSYIPSINKVKDELKEVFHPCVMIKPARLSHALKLKTTSPLVYIDCCFPSFAVAHVTLSLR